MNQLFFSAFLVSACWCWALPTIAVDFADQRQIFLEARTSLVQGNLVTFKRLLPDLVDYPLYGYLIHDDIKARFIDVTDLEIQTFLNRHSDLPIANTLRTTWLKRLAKEERWSDFLSNYREIQETALRCLHLRARLTASSINQAWMQEVRTLWLVGKRQPPECEKTFIIWQVSGGMTVNDLWQRITLTFDADNLDLAEELSLRLPADDRLWVQVWARVHRNPLVGLGDPLLVHDSQQARQVVRHGITRLARENFALATDRWQILKDRYAFDANERWLTERSMALRAATTRHADALQLLERLAFTDAEVRRARVSAALWAEHWPAVLRYVRALKPWERTADRWRYWEARSLEETKQPGAEDIYRELANRRSYHGFLAADRVGRPYTFNYRPLATIKDDLARLETQPAMVRAHEWFFIGDLPEGRREWTSAIASANALELIAAAQLADQWDWPDRVIATLGRSAEEDDLVLRFPLPYQRQVRTRATQVEISPALVFAIARQESIFMPDVRSSAGALGLMQLMPATAMQVAKGLKVPFTDNSVLLNPDTNLHLGSTFLAQMIKRQGSFALAAAAYNAGPGRIKQWRPPAKMAADVWVESIPFSETRRYVRNVLAYAVIYGWRLNLSIGRIADLMPMVRP